MYDVETCPRIHSCEHYRTSFCITSVKINYFSASPCSCESVIKKDSVLMNWVDYSGHIMVVQGYVSLQKSIGTQTEHKAALTPAPWDMTVHPRVRVGRLLDYSTVRLLFCIWLVFFFFSSLYRSNGSTFLHFQIFPFRAFHETYLTHFLDIIFDVSYLSRLFLETVRSGGISTTSNIYEYFGRQLKGLQRASDYT